MPRDQRAYIADVIDSCEAIELAAAGLDLSAYTASRLVRSSVEREFIIIGDAITALSRTAPSTFEAITNSRRIIDFRISSHMNIPPSTMLLSGRSPKKGRAVVETGMLVGAEKGRSR